MIAAVLAVEAEARAALAALPFAPALYLNDREAGAPWPHAWLYVSTPPNHRMGWLSSCTARLELFARDLEQLDAMERALGFLDGWAAPGSEELGAVNVRWRRPSDMGGTRTKEAQGWHSTILYRVNYLDATLLSGAAP